jgi:membrane protein DedA with SNARE-associated domain
MDHTAKRNMCVLAWMPAIAWGIVLIYYLFTLGPVISAAQTEDHKALVTLTADHYNTLFLMGAIAAVISAFVLIYFVVHIARVRTLNGATKMMWILILAALMPISLLLFYYLEIRNERRNLPVHPDIA